MLNLLVSDALLRQSMHSEQTFSKWAFIIMCVALLVSVIIGGIMIGTTNKSSTVGMLPPMLCIAVCLAFSVALTISGAGTATSTSASVAGHDNHAYQSRMLHNNTKIRHYRKQYHHYHHLLVNANQKPKIIHYTSLNNRAKHHLNRLEHYNRIHQDKANVPALERYLS